MTVVLYLPFKYYPTITFVKNKKHFNQFTMSLLFYVILSYIILFVSDAASVGTEQISTGHLLCALTFFLSEFVNSYDKIQHKGKSVGEFTLDKLSVFKGMLVI